MAPFFNFGSSVGTCSIRVRPVSDTVLKMTIYSFKHASFSRPMNGTTCIFTTHRNFLKLPNFEIFDFAHTFCRVNHGRSDDCHCDSIFLQVQFHTHRVWNWMIEAIFACCCARVSWDSYYFLNGLLSFFWFKNNLLLCRSFVFLIHFIFNK